MNEIEFLVPLYILQVTVFLSPQRLQGKADLNRMGEKVNKAMVNKEKTRKIKRLEEKIISKEIFRYVST